MNAQIQAIIERHKAMQKTNPAYREHDNIKAVLCYGDMECGQWQVTAPIDEDIKPEQIEALFSDYIFNWTYPTLMFTAISHGVAIVNTHGKK